MKKSALRHDKYFLRDLHQEIDLYDRKLAYLSNHVEFASAGERQEAEKKLLAKRDPLEKTARELAASGVEFDTKDLPRSFRAASLEQDNTGQNIFLVNPS
jgi:hypothetical protein